MSSALLLTVMYIHMLTCRQYGSTLQVVFDVRWWPRAAWDLISWRTPWAVSSNEGAPSHPGEGAGTQAREEAWLGWLGRDWLTGSSRDPPAPRWRA